MYYCEDQKAMGEHFRGNNNHGKIDAWGTVFLKISSIWVSPSHTTKQKVLELDKLTVGPAGLSLGHVD